MTLWAQREESQLGQFGIGSLFFLTIFSALFLAAVRGVISLMSLVGREPIDPLKAFAPIAVVLIIYIIASLPFMLGLTEGLLWAGVWLIRQPWVRRCMLRRKNSAWAATGQGGSARAVDHENG